MLATTAMTGGHICYTWFSWLNYSDNWMSVAQGVVSLLVSSIPSSPCATCLGRSSASAAATHMCLSPKCDVNGADSAARPPWSGPTRRLCGENRDSLHLSRCWNVLFPPPTSTTNHYWADGVVPAGTALPVKLIAITCLDNKVNLLTFRHPLLLVNAYVGIQFRLLFIEAAGFVIAVARSSSVTHFIAYTAFSVISTSFIMIYCIRRLVKSPK